MCTFTAKVCTQMSICTGQRSYVLPATVSQDRTGRPALHPLFVKLLAELRLQWLYKSVLFNKLNQVLKRSSSCLLSVLRQYYPVRSLPYGVCSTSNSSPEIYPVSMLPVGSPNTVGQVLFIRKAPGNLDSLI